MTGIAFAIALVVIAALAWDAWRRYLAHGKRVDAARLEVVDDLTRQVAEVRREVDGIRMRVGFQK